MKKKKEVNKILILLCVISFIGHLIIFPKLPETIPVHWNASGEINGYGSRLTDLFMGALPLMLCILMYIIPVLDPRRKSYEKHQKAYGMMIIFITVVMIGVSWLTAFVALGYNLDVERIIPMGVGVLFIIIGNYMPQLRSNYFVGVRTPWAIENTWVWRKTQKMGGITFVIMGAVIFITVFLPPSFQAGILLTVILGGVVWNYLYSYLVYIKAKKTGKLGKYEE